MTTPERFHFYDDASAWRCAVAQCIAHHVAARLQQADTFSLVLAGGQTPAALYRELAEAPYDRSIPWSRVHFFWGDERMVEPHHEWSNYHMAQASLLYRLPLRPEQVHRIRGEADDVAAAAAAYEAELQASFPAAGAAPPVFDLVLLGMGADGHVASLFPGSAALGATCGRVAAVPAPALPPHVPRVSLTLPVFNAARAVFFLAALPGKEAVIRDLQGGHGAAYPAAQVQPGRAQWFISRQAP